LLQLLQDSPGLVNSILPNKRSVKMESLIIKTDVESVEDLLDHSFKYSRGRPLTYMELELKLKEIKSRSSIFKEIESLLKHKKIKRISVKVNGCTIPFYQIR